MSDLKLPSIENLDTLGVLFALLPGLLTFLIVRGLTAREKKLEAVEAVLHGLAYTLLAHAVWALLTLRSWYPTPDIVGLSLSAIGLGLVVAKIFNAGWLYEFFRLLGITEESSWQSTWESSFRHQARGGEKDKPISAFAVLHLKDRRRLMGAVRAYSLEQSDGHVAVDEAQWLVENGPPQDAHGFILIPGDNIDYVQFLPK